MKGFPQYRKYKNNASYFIIHNNNSFTEFKKEGEGYKAYHFEAKILPDRNYIADMLYDFKDYWEEINEDEFNSISTS